MRERERVLLCRNDEKGHGGRAGEQGIRSFRSSAMREPLFGSYTEEEGEKK